MNTHTNHGAEIPLPEKPIPNHEDVVFIYSRHYSTFRRYVEALRLNRRYVSWLSESNNNQYRIAGYRAGFRVLIPEDESLPFEIESRIRFCGGIIRHIHLP